MNFDKTHHLLCYSNHRTTEGIAAALGWVITYEENNPCMYCITAIAKQKTLNCTRNPKTRESTGQIGIDISTNKSPRKSEIIVSMISWMMVVNEGNCVDISSFHKNIDDIVEYLVEKLSNFKILESCVKDTVR